MKTKLLLLTLILALSFQGCSIKKNDSDALAVAKHTMNAPLYVVYGVGKVASDALELSVLGTVAGVKKVAELSSDSKGSEKKEKPIKTFMDMKK